MNTIFLTHVRSAAVALLLLSGLQAAAQAPSSGGYGNKTEGGQVDGFGGEGGGLPGMVPTPLPPFLPIPWPTNMPGDTEDPPEPEPEPEPGRTPNPAYTTLMGQVTDEVAQPMEGQIVVVSNEQGGAVAMVVTDRRGVFRLDLPSRGSFKLAVVDTAVMDLPVSGGMKLLIVVEAGLHATTKGGQDSNQGQVRSTALKSGS